MTVVAQCNLNYLLYRDLNQLDNFISTLSKLILKAADLKAQ